MNDPKTTEEEKKKMFMTKFRKAGLSVIAATALLAGGAQLASADGEVIMQDGAPTGALPGRLVRACKQGDSHLPNTPQPHSKEEAA